MDRGYTLDRTLRKVKKGKKALEAYRAKFEDGVRISKDLCNNSKLMSNMFHSVPDICRSQSHLL